MTAHAETDTIFARASGPGRSGVAVYRVSGAEAHAFAGALGAPAARPREARLSVLRDPESGETIDSGLVILFESPASFTGEDVAEFHLHGSHAVETALCEALGRLGARPAGAGEFTLRALRNGKLDLAQVEALADLVDAETSEQRRQALVQLDGRLSAVAEGWRARLLTVLAALEADIDFPDEDDVPSAVAARAGPEIDALLNELRSYLEDAPRHRAIREGIAVAIIGAPNAGKSSLINRLAGSDVAIVSERPGTTRDVLTARLDLSGVPVTFADTAGLRNTYTDEIEEEGMRRAQAQAETADIRIGVADPAVGVPRETLKLLKKHDFLLWNKADLGTPAPEPAPEGLRVLTISARTGAGAPAFLDMLAEEVGERCGSGGGAALTHIRHQRAVEEAVAALERARNEAAPELAAEDARLAARALGQITGAVGVEDVLGEIFASFCIGK